MERRSSVANETMGKWFPSVISFEELEQIVAEKSMVEDMLRRLPRNKVSMLNLAYLEVGFLS